MSLGILPFHEQSINLENTYYVPDHYYRPQGDCPARDNVPRPARAKILEGDQIYSVVPFQSVVLFSSLPRFWAKCLTPTSVCPIRKGNAAHPFSRDVLSGFLSS